MNSVAVSLLVCSETLSGSLWEFFTLLLFNYAFYQLLFCRMSMVKRHYTMVCLTFVKLLLGDIAV